MKISIPSSVEKIGNGAFEDCLNLEKLEFEPQSSLVSIGNFAFRRCISLENDFEIPQSAECGQFVFKECFAPKYQEENDPCVDLANPLNQKKKCLIY